MVIKLTIEVLQILYLFIYLKIVDLPLLFDQEMYCKYKVHTIFNDLKVRSPKNRCL